MDEKKMVIWRVRISTRKDGVCDVHDLATWAVTCADAIADVLGRHDCEFRESIIELSTWRVHENLLRSKE